MEPAVDSSVLFAILNDEPTGRRWLEHLLARGSGSPIPVCEVVFAEVATLFGSVGEAIAELKALGVRFEAISASTAFLAGQIYRSYRQAGGVRATMVPDFLVGAHALRQAGGLMTMDRGYLRGHFQGLKVFTSPPAT